MASYRVLLVCCSILLYFTSSVFCATHVPVILWQSSSLNSGGLSSVSVVEPLTKDEFNKDVLQKLDIPGPIVMFVEPKLSLEDFTLWSNSHNVEGEENSFANLKSIVMNHPASMLPAVESPEQTLREFSTDRQIIELDVSSEIPNSVDHCLLIVKLPDGKNRQKTLSTGDKLMAEFLKKMSSKNPTYTGVYTGSKSSWSLSDEKGDKSRIKRHILAADETVNKTTGIYFSNINNCSLIYFEAVTFRYYIWDNNADTQDLQFSELLNGTYSSNVNDPCTENTTTIVISYQGVSGENITSFDFSMILDMRSDGNWYASDIQLKYRIIGENEDRSNDLMLNDIWAPEYFSYHCSAADFNYDLYNLTSGNNASGNIYGEIYFQNFQVQPFNRTSIGFGNPWDCIGFFTVGIWMAIVVIAILIIILGFGIYTTFIIKTMDRFDDPKGKTITVSATD
ncbi:hypothetical protein CHUAL_004957 [Chamberlinius hualienensis]